MAVGGRLRTIRPLSRERLGAGWIIRVERALDAPFAVGEVVQDASSKLKILQLEGTTHPQQIDLIVEPMP